MKDRKGKTSKEADRRSATKDRDPDPIPGEPAEEMKLPSRNPAPVRPIEDPNPQRRNQLDSGVDGVDEDDDATGEMDSAGQDVGLVVEERKASSVESSGAADEEADWIDHDDATDKGRGQFD